MHPNQLHTIPPQNLIHQVFLLHPGAQAVKVSRVQDIPLQWVQHAGPPSTWCGRTESGRREKAQIFTEDSLASLFDYIIDHTYVQFGGHVFQQRIGIPMGINFAVHLSNYYLFTYEYDFLLQLRAALHDPSVVAHNYAPAAVWAMLQQPDPPLQSQSSAPAAAGLRASRWQPIQQQAVLSRKDVARMILDAYAYTVRYVDDLLSIANPVFPSLLYTSSTWHGFSGVYPPALRLELASQGRQVVYMDMQLTAQALPSPERDNAPVAVLESTLYDKCIHGPLAGLNIIKYPHILSNLSWECKYNILTTEFFRFMRNITSQPNFCSNLARILLHMARRGYQLQLLLARLQVLFRQHYYNWRTAWPELFLEVLLALASLQLDTFLPGLGVFIQQQIYLARQQVAQAQGFRPA